MVLNTRFQEIAGSVGIHFEEGRDNRIHYIQTVVLQEFAERIVQECVNNLQKRSMGDNNREDIEVKRCIEDIQNYFGVKQ